MTNAAISAREEWRRGWGVVVAATLGFSFFSLTTSAMGVFMGPIGDEFGWGRALLSAGLTVSSVATGLLSPPFGILIDRYGSRRLALPGIVVTSAAIAMLSLANGSPVLWLAMWLFYASISITVKTTVWTSAVSGMFSAGRGLALGIMLCGTAMAQIIVPPLSNWLIDAYGWRMAFVWLGLCWGAVTFIVCWFFLYDAHDRRGKEGADEPAAVPATFTGLSLPEARRSWVLWRIAIAAFLIMTVALGLQIHSVPILVEAGVTRTNAAWLASMAGAAGIAGKLITGTLLDRYRANWVGGLTLGTLALAFALLLDGIRNPQLIVLAMAVNGYAAGCKLHICTYLTSRHAGMKNFGVIYGFMTAVVAVGSGLGPLLAGAVHDLAGGYGPFLVAGVAGSVLAGLLVFSLPGYPDWEAREKQGPLHPA